MAQNISFDVIARDKASKTFSNISRSSKSTEGTLKKFGGTASKALSFVGFAGATAGVVSFLKASNAEAREAQRTGALTTQVIKSTGGAAKVTAKHIGDLSTAISLKTGIDDEQIQSGENMLLTFKGIRNEAGKNNKIFDQATQITTDLAAAMAAASGGQLNLKTASIQVGKALNDPIKGLTALGRVGVTFTKGQQAQIKKLVESGQKMKAQKIILRELKSEFGGAAASQATAGDKARVAWKNLEEQVGTGLLPVVDDLANRVTNDVVPAVSKFVKEMQDGTGAGGEFADKLKDIYQTGKHVVDFFDDLPGPVKKFAVEGGIALLVLSKMRGLFGPTATSINSFVGGLAHAETRMDTTARAARRLGSGIQALAGAGGLMAIADGAKRGDSAVGALETTLGGAAAGFAAGGPIGAAVGGLGGYMFSLYRATRDAGGAAEDTAPSWKKYADTLNGVGAATSHATRELVLNRLEKSGVLRQAEALGISDRDAVQAAMGNEAARKRVTAALADATAKGKTYQSLQVAQHLGAETTAIQESRVAQLKKNLALAATDAEAKKIQAKLDRLGRTNANPNIRLVGAAKVINQLNAILQLQKDVTHSKGGNAQLPSSGSLLGQLSARAGGGPVVAGQPYIVGERRPELFIPQQSGRIVPKVPTGVASESASAPQFVFSGPIYAQDVNDFLRQVQERSRHAATSGVRSGVRR